MPQKLKNLIINRVALVDAGANPEADIVLYKRKDEPAVEPVVKTTFNELLEENKFRDVVYEICYMTYDLESAIASSLWAEGDRAAEIKTSVQQFSEAVNAALTSWLEGKPVTKRDLAMLQKQLTERITKLANKENDTMDIAKILAEATDEQKAELRKGLGIQEPVAKTEETEPTEEEILKALPEPARKMIEKANADAAQAAKDAAEAVEKARKADEARERVELEKRITEEFPNLPGTMDEKVAALKSAVGNEHLMKMLKAGNEAATQSLLKARGDGSATATGSAWATIEKRAKELVEKGACKSFEIAVSKVCNDDPELHRRYDAEKRG